MAQYRQTVLGALRDGERSRSRFANVRPQLARLGDIERTATESSRLNRPCVEAERAAWLTSPNVERRRLSAAIGVAQAKAQLTLSYIAVQKSPGSAGRMRRPTA